MLVLPVLTSERVTVREWRSEDAESLQPACGDPDIRFTTLHREYTPSAAHEWIGRQQAHVRDGTAVVWAIVPPGGDVPVGMVGLFGLSGPGSTARFGYWLTSAWRGRGLVSAATALVAAWGFSELGLTAIHIDREPANRASYARRPPAGSGRRRFASACVRWGRGRADPPHPEAQLIAAGRSLRRYDLPMSGSPQRRLLWVRILVPLMLIIGVAAAIGGAWPTAIVMGVLIVAQILVYRRAKEELEARD
jgi:RimJ/RimL family protein N-acetyltransferase